MGHAGLGKHLELCPCQALPVMQDEEDDKDEVIFANPVHGRCRKKLSMPNSLNILTFGSKAILPEFSLKRAATVEIMPWTAFQNELIETRRRGSLSLEPKVDTPTSELNETRTESENRQSLSDPVKDSNPATAYTHPEMKRTNEWEGKLAKAEKSQKLVMNISNLPSQAIQLTTNEGADAKLLEFERFVSQSSSTTRNSCGDDVHLDIAVGNIIDSMMSNLTDANALEQGLCSLRTISVDEGTRNLIGISGGIRAAIAAIAAFPSNERLQEQGATFLADICQCSKANKLQVGHSGGMQIIVASMRNASHRSISLLEKSCETLQTCCDDCEFNQRLAGEVGGVEVILTAMRKGKEAVSLQEKCLRTLLTLATNNIKIVLLIQEGGGVQEILAAIRQFSAIEAIQTAGIQLSLEILRQSDDIRCCLGNGGLIDDIERRLPQYSHSSRYVVSCCGCIRYLAFNSDNRARMAAGTIIPLLSRALQAWIVDERVVLSILLALGNTTFDCARAKHVAARDGGASTLVALLSQYANHTSIVEQTSRVLRNIADGKTNAKRHCVRAGAVSGLAKAMETLPGAAGVQEHAAAALLNLSSIQEGALRNTKLEEHVKRALLFHHGMPDAGRQLEHLQKVLDQLGNRSMLLGGLFGGTRASTPTLTTLRPPAEDVLHEPALVSAVAALSAHEGDTDY